MRRLHKFIAFYPDFIVKTKSGKYIVAEYKGRHLAGDDDSQYKKSLGEQWEKLGEWTQRFFWIEQENIDRTIHEIGNI